MTDEELQLIRDKVITGNPHAVLVDRQQLLEELDRLRAILAQINATALHGRSIAQDIQEIVRLSKPFA
jgi:hypothetical protein